VVSDNGTELTSSAVLTWSQDCAIGCHYVAPGKPTLNVLSRASMASDATHA
jgi:putative transposase